jgi:SAM-dependent methyltransferase
LSSSGNYWETRYGKGGSSGAGSIGGSRRWKWNLIHSYAANVDDVIDIGCGDLRFWEDHEIDLPESFRYFGLDISSTIVQHNRTSHPTWIFHVGNASCPIPGLQGRIVLCLDVLFHIMDDDAFVGILENLCHYSLDWIFIFTWWRNPFSFGWRLRHLYGKVVAEARRKVLSRNLQATHLLTPLHFIRTHEIHDKIRFLALPTESDGVYEKYRRFEDYTGIFQRNGFRLIGAHKSPHSGRNGAMYVFRRCDRRLLQCEPSSTPIQKS